MLFELLTRWMLVQTLRTVVEAWRYYRKCLILIVTGTRPPLNSQTSSTCCSICSCIFRRASSTSHHWQCCGEYSNLRAIQRSNPKRPFSGYHSVMFKKSEKVTVVHCFISGSFQVHLRVCMCACKCESTASEGPGRRRALAIPWLGLAWSRAW